MNLVWHITRKDLRRFWVPTLLLGAVAALRLGVGVSLLHSAGFDPEGFLRLVGYATVLQVLGFLVTFLLAAAVLEEDAAAAPAFWQTRPIPRPALLAAKALALVILLGLVPAVITLPWWLGCGLSLAQIAHAAAEVLALQGLVIVVAAPWAAVTGTFGRFLLWTLVAAVAAATYLLVFATHVLTLPGNVAGSGPSRILLVAAIALIGGIAVTVHQYATRRTARSLVLLLVFAGGAAGVVRWSTWDASRFWAPRADESAPLSAGVRLAYRDLEKYPTVQPDLSVVGFVAAAVTDVPAGYTLESAYSDQVIRWPDGVAFRQARIDSWELFQPLDGGDLDRLLGLHRRVETPTSDPDFIDHRERRLLTRRDAFSPPRESVPSWLGRFTVSVPANLSAKLTDTPAELDATYWFHLVKPAVVGRVPLTVGAEMGHGSAHTLVASVGTDAAKGAVRVAFVERFPALAWSEFLDPLQVGAYPADPTYVYLGEQGALVRAGLNEVRYPATLANVTIVLRQDVFTTVQSRWDSSVHRWVNEPEDKGPAELAEIFRSPVENFSRSLRVDHLSWAAAPTAEAARRIGLVTVSGAVVRPVIADLYAGQTPVQAIRQAGGFSDAADMARVVLVRKSADGTTARRLLDLKAYLDEKVGADTLPTLQPGDVIEVPEVGQP